LVLIGLAIAIIGNMSFNTTIMFVGVLFMGPGGYFLYNGIKGRDTTEVKRLAKQKYIDENPPNTIINRPKVLELTYLDPEYVEDLPILAMPRKCFNDGKSFYLLEQVSAEDETLQDILLPDNDDKQIHYPPDEEANVISMPSNKRYFEWSATLFQKIAIGFLVLIVVVEIIALVILGGNTQ